MYEDIARELVKAELAREASGIERLLTKHKQRQTFEAQLKELGLSTDLREPIVKMIAWSILGPILAGADPHFWGNMRGRPHKCAESLNIQRAEFVERVQVEFNKLEGNLLPVRELVEHAQRQGCRLFPPTTELKSLVVSVAKGRKELKERTVDPDTRPLDDHSLGKNKRKIP